VLCFILKLKGKTMLKKILPLMCALMLTNVYAYKIGDSIDPAIAKKLNIDNSKVTVIDFFASWCVSCKHELPLINKVNTTMDKKKFEIIGVCTDKVIAKGKGFTKELGLKFRVYTDNEQEIIKAFNPVGMPALYVVKDGKVVDSLMGAVANIDKVLKNRLAEEK